MRLPALSILLLTAFLPACVQEPNPGVNNLTHGAVQLTLKKGITTQADVLEKFGAPNIATINAEGQEVWTYQRHATTASSSEGYLTIGLAGFGKSGAEESSRSMTLIIKFSGDKKVSDFNSMYSSF